MLSPEDCLSCQLPASKKCHDDVIVMYMLRKPFLSRFAILSCFSNINVVKNII